MIGRFNTWSLPTRLLLGLLLLVLVVTVALLLQLYPRYWLAILDASSPTEGEISENLTTISEGNDILMWKDGPKGIRLLVVTWAPVDETFHDSDEEERLEKGYSFYTGEEIWVTTVPELKTACRRVRPECSESTLRLKELLGVAPHDQNAQFDEFWVLPSDLFRPCLDPEITDSACGLNAPPDVDPQHIEWFHEQEGRSYGPLGYPWTQLGYTYDWGNPQGHIGLSEFVIENGANVTVESVTPTDRY